MYDQMTCEALPSATFLPESACGALPCVMQDGLTTAKCGQAVAHASLSARQAKALDLLTSGTCGQPFTGSFNSAYLQLYLESRLRQSVLALGSTLYKMTWKPWAMPSGRSRFRLAVSAVTTLGSARTGVPTPTSTVVDEKPRPPITRGRKPSDPQIGLADIAVYLLAPAMTPSGLHAPMESRARLNPDYARWLMHIPREWLNCAPLEMPSTRKPRKFSFKPRKV